ncbi:MAG TPA: hypothetical protein DEQ50_08830 [Lactobacillus sp.]|nr:hypothetical protein [Lactobacillus sp.]
MDKNTLMTLIDNASKDKVVKKDSKLFASLVSSYKDLDDDKDIKVVVRKLSGSISSYLMTHKYESPKDLIKLASAMRKTNNNFWKGTGITKLFW